MDHLSAFFPLIPVSTARAARALYGRGNLYIRLGDRLNYLATRFSPEIRLMHGHDEKSTLLGLLTVIQYVEKLTDVELAEAIQRRMDLRYAVHLATPSVALSPWSLCEFRSKILTAPDYHKLFEEMFGLIYAEITSTVTYEKPQIDEVLRSICENEIRASLNEAMLRSMEALSANYFNWLRQVALPHWYQRYNRSLLLLSSGPSLRKQEPTRDDLQRDLQHLLCAIRSSNSREIMEMQETKDLQFIWEQLTDATSMNDCDHCVKKLHR
jgi:transposase-like protein DUF772